MKNILIIIALLATIVSAQSWSRPGAPLGTSTYTPSGQPICPGK